jgi:serine/threonine protein kinase
MRVFLDPTTIDSATNAYCEVFARLLRATASTALLHANKDYVDPASGDSINLTHSILNIPKYNPRTGKQEPHYYVFADNEENTLGKGTFGRVVKVQGTVTLTDQQKKAIFKPHQAGKHRVLKIARIAKSHYDPAHTTHTMLRCETDKQKRLTTTHTRGPAIARDNSETAELGLILSAEFRGQDLRNLLTLDSRNGNQHLSIAQRLQLTVNIIRAYIEQIDDNKIIHRDIKPENIMIDSATFAVHFIDFGFALNRDDSDDDRSIAGTPVYMAPEVVLESAYSRASDLYALGLVIAEVWQSKSLSKNVLDSAYGKSRSNPLYGLERFHSAFTKNQTTEQFEYLHSNIFQSITDEELVPEHKNSLKKIIQKMLQPHPEKRISASAAYRAFKEVAIAFTTPHLDTAALLKQANRIGLSAYRQLRDVRLYETKHSFTRMLEAVDNIDRVADDAAAIKTFLAALGVQALQTDTILNAANTKRAVKNAATEIIATFIDNINRLLLLQQAVDITQSQLKKQPQQALQGAVDQLFGEINVLWHKERHANVTLDELVRLNQRFAQSMPTLTRLADALPQALQATAQGNEDQKKRRLLMYQQLVARLAKPIQHADPALSKLSRGLRAAIQSYIQQTISTKNLRKNDRAGSNERLEEMTSLLTAIENAETAEQLSENVTTQLKKVSRVGLFGSRLKKNLETALKANQAIRSNRKR